MKRPKSKRKSKSNHHQEPANQGQFSFNITRIAVAQICKSVGFRHSQGSALNTLTIVATKYIATLAKSAASFSEAANRTQLNLLDITNALHDMSLQMGFNGGATLHKDGCLLKSAVLEDLSSFVGSTDEIPFAKPIERAKESKKEVEAPKGNSQRGGHVPEWLPGFPDVASNEPFDGRAANGETLWENSRSVVECQGGDGFKEKRDGSSELIMCRTRRVKFKINGAGGGKRVHLNNLFSQSNEEEAEGKPLVVSKENQILVVYKRRKKT